MNKVRFLIAMTAFWIPQLSAQSVSKNTADTTKVVTITSAFKPSLRPLSKVNFLAATPFIDNSKVTMQYVIPSQNISFGYQAVAVTPNAGDDAGKNSTRIRGISGPEAKGVHNGNGTRAHRQNVANDATDAGGRTLIGLYVRRVIVALDLEGHGPTITDVDYTCIFANADEKLWPAFGGLLLSELTQVNLGGLVGAVLTPHDAVHR